MPKIVRFYETGGAEVLKIEELPLVEPGEGEVRLSVEAIGLNRAEVMFRQGQYLENPEMPSRLGYEARCIVDVSNHLPFVLSASQGFNSARLHHV